MKLSSLLFATALGLLVVVSTTLAEPTPTPSPGKDKSMAKSRTVSKAEKAAPNPQALPAKSYVVLNTGNRAVVENDRLMLMRANGTKTRAVAGQYVTKDGRRLSVDAEGRATIVGGQPVAH